MAPSLIQSVVSGQTAWTVARKTMVCHGKTRQAMSMSRPHGAARLLSVTALIAVMALSSHMLDIVFASQSVATKAAVSAPRPPYYVGGMTESTDDGTTEPTDDGTTDATEATDDGITDDPDDGTADAGEATDYRTTEASEAADYGTTEASGTADDRTTETSEAADDGATKATKSTYDGVTKAIRKNASLAAAGEQIAVAQYKGRDFGGSAYAEPLVVVREQRERSRSRMVDAKTARSTRRTVHRTTRVPVPRSVRRSVLVTRRKTQRTQLVALMILAAAAASSAALLLAMERAKRRKPVARGKFAARVRKSYSRLLRLLLAWQTQHRLGGDNRREGGRTTGSSPWSGGHCRRHHWRARKFALLLPERRDSKVCFEGSRAPLVWQSGTYSPGVPAMSNEHDVIELSHGYPHPCRAFTKLYGNCFHEGVYFLWGPAFARNYCVL
ncbi:putative transmembrane protein [Toxoplasma gondii VAND]|uniref:Putative transmembrane protein n=1 Tax=Toxoplasma gondii VAND TaxID=933077 RepID=A0A086PJJ2_TOXGO|nr:putative transmembrane protein [Toxoplasma gondii VAND]